MPEDGILDGIAPALWFCTVAVSRRLVSTLSVIAAALSGAPTASVQTPESGLCPVSPVSSDRIQTGSSIDQRWRRTLTTGLPAAIFLVTLMAFVPALDGQFVNWDDDRNFLGNTAYRGLGWPQLRWMWTTTLMGHYIPLTWMSLGVTYLLHGMNPWGYHLGSMLIHGANAVLFFFVARRLLAAARAPSLVSSLAGAAFTALVFAIHPLRVESVAWATERRDVLCGFFFLSSVLGYLRSVEPGEQTRRWRLLSLAAFVAALLSKAQALPLPLALLILDVYPLRRVRQLSWRRVAMEKIPYVALSIAGAIIALVAVANGSGFTNYHQYPASARLGMTAYSLAFYPWKWLWPVGLSPLYELPARVDPLAPRFLIPLFVLAAMTTLLVILRHRWPAGLAAWGYSALMVLPVVGPVHAGHQLANDRYSYLSGLGFALLAGAALIWLLKAGRHGVIRRFPLRVGAAAAPFILLGLGALTWIQAGGWRDSETLWTWAVELDPECAACYSNLAEAIARDRPHEAESALLRSLALRDRPVTRSNLGAVLELQGRIEEAQRMYQEALRADPDLPEALANLGMLHANRGRHSQALPLLRRAYQVAPEFPGVRRSLPHVLERRALELADSDQMAEAQALLAEASTVVSREIPRTVRR